MPDTFKLEILARVVDGMDPVLLGTLEVPIEVVSGVTLGEPRMVPHISEPPVNPWTELAPDPGDTTKTFTERMKAAEAAKDVPDITEDDEPLVRVNELPLIELNEVEGWTTSEWNRRRGCIMNRGSQARPLWVDGKTSRQYTPKAAALVTGDRRGK